MEPVNIHFLINPFAVNPRFPMKDSFLAERIVFLCTPFFTASALAGIGALLLFSGTSSIIPMVILANFAVFNIAILIYSARSVYYAKSNILVSEIKPPRLQNNRDAAEPVPKKIILPKKNNVINEIQKAEPQLPEEEVQSQEEEVIEIREIVELAPLQPPIESEKKASGNLSQLLPQMRKERGTWIAAIDEAVTNAGIPVAPIFKELIVDQALNFLSCFEELFVEGIKGEPFVIYIIDQILCDCCAIMFDEKLNQKDSVEGASNQKSKKPKINEEIRLILKNQANKQIVASFKTADMKDVSDQIDRVAVKLADWFNQFYDTAIPQLIEKGSNPKKYNVLHRDLKAVLGAVQLFFKENLAGMTPGEFFVKSHRVAVSLAETSPTVLIQKFLSDSIQYFEQSDLDTTALENLVTKDLKSFLEEMSNPALNRVFFRAHAHDLILGLLFLFFVMPHLHLFRPWAAKHKTAIMDLIFKELPIQQLKEFESLIRVVFKITLLGLKFVNGVVFGKNIPFKSAAIRFGVKKIFKTIEEKAAEEKKKVGKELNEQDKNLIQMGHMFVTFFLLGFGGNEQEQAAYLGFQKLFSEFYQDLYKNLPILEDMP